MSRLSALIRGNGVDTILRDYPDAVYAFDLEGQFIDFNDALCVMTGYTRQELLGHEYGDLIDPTHLATTRENFAAAVAGNTRRYRSRGRRKSGEIFDVDVTNMPVRDDEGRVVAVMGLARDFTAETRLSEWARANESVAKIAARMARLAGWSIDAKTETLEWSDALFDILGFEVEGPPTLEESLLKYCGDSSARMATALRRCLTTGESFDEVAMIETGTGDVWDVRVMGEAVRDENGDIVRVVGALYDITALVQQSREVERLERRMTETMNGLQYPLIFVRRDWVVEWANDAACTLFERPRHEVDGASVYTLFPDFEQTQSYTTYLHAMNEGVYSETTVFDPRRQRFFDVSVLPAPDGIVVAVRDVTAEEEAKTVAEESTARANLLAQMVDRSKEAMIIRDFQRGVTYWNRSAEELYGWSHEEALRRPLLELFYDDPEEARRALAIVERDGYWTGEIEQLTKSGAKITVEGRWQLIRDAEGNATGVFGVNRDVTGAKLERELRARNQRMESIGTLASGMAHDLNNVLTPVLLTLEVLNRDQSDPSKRRLIESMEASVKRGADMIRQVLAYARGVEGERDVVDLALVVDEALRLTRDVLPRNIDVQHHADSPVWSVMGDATQLMQVVVNLIINARDAMPNGGVLEIGVRNGYGSDAGRIATDLDGQYFVYVDVVDTGVGIEANALSRVFEPFFTTKPVGAGTGLGLSTSQAIAKSHGGRLDVSSTPGRGTRFTLILPAEVTNTVPVRDDVLDDDSTHDVTGARILVVDDEPNIVAMFQEILRLEGYLVDGAHDGVAALELVDTAPRAYDLIVTDLNMPKLGGEELARALGERGLATRFVFMSGLTVSPQIRGETRFKESVFLQKPFPSVALLDAVKSTLRAD